MSIRINGYHILPFRQVVPRSGRKAFLRKRITQRTQMPECIHHRHGNGMSAIGNSQHMTGSRRLRRTTCRTQDVVPGCAGRGVWRRLVSNLASVAALVIFLLFTATAARAQETQLARERYVPADELDVIFDRTPNGVMLPRAEFEELLQKARAAKSRNADLPTDVAVTAASYEVKQVDSHAVVALQIDVEQFLDGWVMLSFPVSHLDLEEATIDGQPAAVGRHPAQPDTITLLHREPGKFRLSLQLSTPLGTVGSDRVAVFGVLPNAAADLRIACDAKQSVEVNDRKLERPAPVDEATTYHVPVGSSNDVRIRWTSGSQKSDTETLVFARTAAVVNMSVDTLRWVSNTRLSVYGSPVNRLIGSVPATLEITAVESTGLESWKLEDDPDRAGFTRVVLTYRQPFSDDRLVEIRGVASLAGDRPAEIPTLQFVNVTAHTGRLNVLHEDQLRLRAETGTGIRQLSVNEVPDEFADTSVFDFWLQDFRLSVAVRPRDRELFSQVNSHLNFADTLANLQVALTVETLNEPLFEIELSLPEDWQVQELVGSDGQAMTWRSIRQGDNGSLSSIVVEPMVPVAPGDLLSFTLKLRRSVADPATPQSLPLPVVTAAATTLVAGSYRVSSAADLEVAPVEIQGLVPVAGDGESLVFETQGTTFSGQLSVARKPVRISARAELRTWADARQKTTVATITADVTNGTTRTLRLLVPEDAGADLRFDVVSVGAVAGMHDGTPIPSNPFAPPSESGSRGGAGLFSVPLGFLQDATGSESRRMADPTAVEGHRTVAAPPTGLTIVEQSPAEPADGMRAYNLTFNRRFAGSVTLRTLIQNDHTAGDPIIAPFVRVPDAVRQHGLLVLEASPEQELAVPDNAMTGLKQADAGLVDAPAEGSGRRVALVFRYVQPEYSLTVNETRFGTQAVPTAVCEKIENVSLLSDTGSIQRASRVHVRCVGIQTLRFSLPDAGNTFLWSTVLNGEAIEVRRDEADYLVAIPTDSDQNQHTLEILFESSGDEVSGFGTTRQESVSLSIDTEQGTAQPIEILEQTWDVRYPHDSLLLDHDGGFHPLNDMDQPGWLQALGSGFQLPAGLTLWQKLVPLAMFVLVLFVATALVMRRRWAALACVVLALVLLALLLPTVSSVQKSARTAMPMSADSAPTSAMQAGDGGYEEEQTGVDFDFNVQDRFDDDSPVAANGMSSFGSRQLRLGRQGGGQQFGGQPGDDGAMMGAGGAMMGDGTNGYGATMGGAGMGGGGFGGGMGGGGFGGGGIGGGGLGEGSRGTAQPIPQAAEPAAQPVTQPSAGEEAPRRKSGSARLSVRVDLQTPDDYRSTGFRTVGTTNGAGQLDVVIQNRNELMAFRLLTAFVVVLICWWLGRESWAFRLTMIAVLSLLAIAVVPLLPNQWQAVADGVVLGAASSLGLWLVFATCRCCESCVERFRTKFGASQAEAM